MPHDVIMPALGMAQDSGVLVSWLKSPGDAVKAGEGLMEVETDKATMEVEAETDGFLTEIRVQAGESAPVGGVVAVIGDDPEDKGGNAAGAAQSDPAPPPRREDAAPAPPAPSGGEGLPVIMPALGMAQDSGVIVAWLKAVGDAVSADDALFEVETDKATMEVPAGADGYVAALYAEAGASVPVGEVIALVTRDEPAEGAPPPKPAAPSAPSTKREADAPEPPAAEKPANAPSPAARPATAGGARSGARILASPKARRLARERGIDLGALLDAGVAEPIHVADLDRAPAAPAAASAQTATAPTAAPAQRASAEVEAAPFAAFLDWLAAESGAAAPRGETLAAFAAAALRSASGGARVGVSLTGGLGASERRFADPDRAPLSQIAEGEADADLRLRDLAGTAITGLSLGGSDAPTLTLCRSGDRLRVDYEGALPPDQALALLEGFAARLADPLRHML